MTATYGRFTWATEIMNIKPADNVLEIGCGAGLLAELVADRIETGKVWAVDKSAPMLEKARKRNQIYINNQISKFITAEFSKAKLPHSYFDHIVAFNVNFFWKNPARELLLIKQALKKNGKLYVFYQAPNEITLAAAEPICKKLIENSFNILDTRIKKFQPTSAFCIITKLQSSD